MVGAISLALVLSFVGCNGRVDVEDETNPSGEQIATSGEEKELETNDKYANVEQNPIVTMTMQDGGVVRIELYPQVAPTTVENFISLVSSGFYDGLTFHRVIPTFMAQGGDPSGDGTGGPGYTIKGEFSENGFKNDISHEVGVISMARTSDNNGAGSQFFIVTNENSYLSLDGLYAAFGKVIEGMDVVDRVVNAEVIRREVDDDVYQAFYEAYLAAISGEELTSEQEKAIDAYYEQAAEMDRPVTPPVIQSMTVETFGVTYDEPEKILPES